MIRNVHSCLLIEAGSWSTSRKSSIRELVFWLGVYVAWYSTVLWLSGQHLVEPEDVLSHLSCDAALVQPGCCSVGVSSEQPNDDVHNLFPISHVLIRACKICDDRAAGKWWGTWPLVALYITLRSRREKCKHPVRLFCLVAFPSNLSRGFHHSVHSERDGVSLLVWSVGCLQCLVLVSLKYGPSSKSSWSFLYFILYQPRTLHTDGHIFIYFFASLSSFFFVIYPVPFLFSLFVFLSVHSFRKVERKQAHENVMLPRIGQRFTCLNFWISWSIFTPLQVTPAQYSLCVLQHGGYMRQSATTLAQFSIRPVKLCVIMDPRKVFTLRWGDVSVL